MPHLIITQLKALEQMDFASHLGTENPHLTSGERDMPEEALDAVDAVIDHCVRIFGAHAPNQEQLRHFAAAGFPVTVVGNALLPGKLTKIIHTSKGLIAYK